MNTKTMTFPTVCLLAATVLFTPGISHAGWFSNAQPAKKIVKKVKATPGNVQAKVADISKKLNEIHSHIAENRPLMEKVKNGAMMKNLMEIVEFMGDQQQEYQAFASNGVHGFRQDFQDMLYGFGDVINEFPALENADRLNDKLDNAADLIHKIPSQFLFIMHKAVGSKLISINEQISGLRIELAKLPKLPKPRILMQNPQAYEVELCKMIDSRETAVSVAIVQAKLKTIIWILKTITSYLPDDLTFNVTAVAGGGFTATKHPAKVPFQIPLTILEAVELGIGNNVSIANAMCKGVVPAK